MPTRAEPRPQPPALERRARPAVTLDGVWRTYRDGRGGEVPALAGLDLLIDTGEVVAIVGRSGAGKSTLLELICGLQAPDRGGVVCEEAVLMPQRDLLLPWLSALDNAALPLRLHGATRDDARARAGELFARAGLERFSAAPPGELSGGMRQRVAFVRTLVSGKPVLCLDEPFGALDAITRREMQDWLVELLAGEPRTVVLVTHDVEEALVLADRVAVLSARPGRVVRELELASPRPRARTGAELLEARELALEALAAEPPA